ncbi:conserved hypothetical protein [Pseudomonas sp. 8Z]|uniref:antibiotic biosynthesis monooxygenase n=1 Tax=Pseudomonas sp. 8Z TaxID=2653166 RepID=UPI0012F26417|nr:antibiotic biosynthesis monooxygenase [Pseudomonas sp. 8Z]VXC34974.1 conserved hypothetical protein [Pseudomonas sp. 8Z]
MCIIHRMTLRARHARTAQLGRCLARLKTIPASDGDCLELKLWQHPAEAAVWVVQGAWCSPVARDAFLQGDALAEVLAQAVDADLIASLQCTQEVPQKAV